MNIRVKGAKEHNLKNVDVSIGSGLTVVTGVSGSGKTSLEFDTLFHEARRRFQEVFAFGSPGSRLTPAKVDSITGVGPAVAVGQNLLNRNPNSTLATASGLHPFIRLLYARFGKRHCKKCGAGLSLLREDEVVEQVAVLSKKNKLMFMHLYFTRHGAATLAYSNCLPGNSGPKRSWLMENYGIKPN